MTKEYLSCHERSGTEGALTTAAAAGTTTPATPTTAPANSAHPTYSNSGQKMYQN